MKRFLTAIFAVFIVVLNAASPALQEIFNLFGVEESNVSELWMQKGKERSDFDKRYEFMHFEAWPLFERAGYVLETEPSHTHYLYAIVYGGLLPTMQKRIAYLESLIAKGIHFDEIVFLTGERPLADSEKAVCGLATESDMVEWSYLRSELPEGAAIIRVPMSGHVRPKTVDTVAAWLETHPQPGYCLGISNQPYVRYQNAVMQSLLPRGFEIETAGPAADSHVTVALILDAIAKQLIYSQSGASDSPVR